MVAFLLPFCFSDSSRERFELTIEASQRAKNAFNIIKNKIMKISIDGRFEQKAATKVAFLHKSGAKPSPIGGFG